MLARLYEALTGKPYTTVRSMAAEFGPPPAVRYRDRLANLTDAELIQGDWREVAARESARRG